MSIRLPHHELQECLDRIHLEIANAFRSGLDRAYVTLNEDEVFELEHIKTTLTMPGRSLHFDEASMRLTIDSGECPRSFD